MSKKRRDPMCRVLTRTLSDKNQLTQMYQRAQHLETETISAICRTRKGKTFLLPYREETGKTTKLGILTTGMYVMPLEDDPCIRADAKLLGTVHVHPYGSFKSLNQYFSEADLSALDKDDKTGCIVYRDKEEVRVKCTSLKTNKSWEEIHPEVFKEDAEMDSPEIDYPHFDDVFTNPCDVTVSKGEILTRRFPWRQF